MNRNSSKGVNSRASVYLTGNTVKLEVEFRNWLEELVDVQFPKLIIYDYKYNKIEEINLGDSNRKEVGIYFYNFVTSDKPDRVIYEFKGELNGLPALDRGMFMTKFI